MNKAKDWALKSEDILAAKPKRWQGADHYASYRPFATVQDKGDLYIHDSRVNEGVMIHNGDAVLLAFWLIQNFGDGLAVVRSENLVGTSIRELV